jgi:AraC-like DNA-binding protein
VSAGGTRSAECDARMTYRQHDNAWPLLDCTWELIATEEGRRIVPHACVDLIWKGEELIIAGPDTGPRLVRMPVGAEVHGARLRPGSAAAVLGIPASELRDVVVAASEVIGRDVAELLLESLPSAPDPGAALAGTLARQQQEEPDRLVGAAVSALGRHRARVDAVAAELGVSQRQLQRRVSDAVGYGPKTLARILRFRRLQKLPPAPLAELALDAGFADQAHMTVEVTRLAGIQPVRFLEGISPRAA